LNDLKEIEGAKKNKIRDSLFQTNKITLKLRCLQEKKNVIN